MTGKEVPRIVALVAVWAAALFVLAFAAESRLPDANGFGLTWAGKSFAMSSRFPLARWDSYWYLDIVERGYEGRNDGGQHNVAFYPLYPVAVGIVSRLFRCGSFAAGTAVSLGALFGAMVLLSLLARDEGFDASATVRAMLWFPTAFFFAATYTESLFLLLSAGCLLAARRGRFGPAALLGVLTGLCRPTGFLLAIPLAWPLLRKRPFRLDRSSRAILLAAASPVLGMTAFLVYVRIRLGDALLPFEIQNSGWHHRFSWPWRPLLRGWLWTPHLRLQVAATVAFFVLAAFLWKRRKGDSLYVAGTLLMACFSGSVLSVPRFVLVLFPAFFILGDLIRRSRVLEAAYATAGVLGLAYCTCRFALGLWVA